METNFVKIKIVPYKNLFDIVREPVFDVSLRVKGLMDNETDLLETALRVSVYKNAWKTEEITQEDSIILNGKTSRIFGRDYVVMFSRGDDGCEIEINAPASLTYSVLKDLSNVANIDEEKLEKVRPPSYYAAVQQEVHLWD